MNKDNINDVIVALSTPPFKSALAIVRASGQGVFLILESLTKMNINDIKNKRYVGYIYNNDKIIDQVVALIYQKPHSSTGEDVVEIICHGSQLIVNEIIQYFILKGARLASRGEFTSRAFLNNKMNLIEAEAVNDLINATTSESKKISLMALDGEVSLLIKPLKEKVAYLLSLIEVNIDFPEYEDIEEANSSLIIDESKKILQNVNELIENSKKGQIVKDGVMVAIIGQPNVGKSSILNALLNKDKAIVSPFPGTTRDVIEDDVYYKGICFHFLDTAGIHQTNQEIEKIGINKALETIKKADIIVEIFDASNNKENEFDSYVYDLVKNKNVLKVYNKSDLISKFEKNKIYTSATNKDIKNLLDGLFNILNLSDDNFNIPSLANTRQIALLENIKSELNKLIKEAKNNIPIDLLATYLNSIYNKIQEILGENVSIDMMDEVFSRFCVGK